MSALEFVEAAAGAVALLFESVSAFSLVSYPRTSWPVFDRSIAEQLDTLEGLSRTVIVLWS